LTQGKRWSLAGKERKIFSLTRKWASKKARKFKKDTRLRMPFDDSVPRTVQLQTRGDTIIERHKVLGPKKRE